jgi:hypothetical protein
LSKVINSVDLNEGIWVRDVTETIVNPDEQTSHQVTTPVNTLYMTYGDADFTIEPASSADPVITISAGKVEKLEYASTSDALTDSAQKPNISIISNEVIADIAARKEMYWNTPAPGKSNALSNQSKR